MRPNATDGVAWSIFILRVCLAVGYVREHCKNVLNRSRCRMGGWLGSQSGGSKETCITWGPDPQGKGQFLVLSGPLKIILNHYYGVRSKKLKKSVTASMQLVQPTALLPIGRCHIKPPPWKIRSADRLSSTFFDYLLLARLMGVIVCTRASVVVYRHL